MSDEEHEKWNQWYREAIERDLERWIYKECDREDHKQAGGMRS